MVYIRLVYRPSYVNTERTYVYFRRLYFLVYLIDNSKVYSSRVRCSGILLDKTTTSFYSISYVVTDEQFNGSAAVCCVYTFFYNTCACVSILYQLTSIYVLLHNVHKRSYFTS